MTRGDAPGSVIRGRCYTMSRLKHPCGDRSWTHDIWEIIETNGGHAVIQAVTARHASSFGRDPMVVPIEEFDWFPADEMAAALAAHFCPDMGIAKGTQP